MATLKCGTPWVCLIAGSGAERSIVHHSSAVMINYTLHIYRVYIHIYIICISLRLLYCVAIVIIDFLYSRQPSQRHDHMTKKGREGLGGRTEKSACMYEWYTKYARHNVPSHAADAPHSASDSRASLHRSGKDSIVLMRLTPLDAYDRQNSQCQHRWVDQARCSMNHLDSRG